MIPTADGQGIIQMASSQITVGGNKNNNEMLVGRTPRVLPSINRDRSASSPP